jgi:hypothetical protein
MTKQELLEKIIHEYLVEGKGNVTITKEHFLEALESAFEHGSKSGVVRSEPDDDDGGCGGMGCRA